MGSDCITAVKLCIKLFPLWFQGRMWDLIVSVPGHCLSFYFSLDKNNDNIEQVLVQFSASMYKLKT